LFIQYETLQLKMLIIAMQVGLKAFQPYSIGTRSLGSGQAGHKYGCAIIYWAHTRHTGAPA
jgi:hypothetical protein